MEIVKIKKLHEDAIIPENITIGSAGFDVYAYGTHNLKYGRQRIPLGFAMEMPSNLMAYCQAKSGMSLKGLLGAYNGGVNEARVDADVRLGLIDSDYRGEVCAIIDVKDYGVGEGLGMCIPHGTPIAQITFHYVPEVSLEIVDELSETHRGERGFGQMDEQ